ncbi:hypothetical protein, partial [Streptomyces sp. ME18-1-4]|uniref:hypothetical protein n=1 Tax=Streptomyces sp. ME18-1-4 TaxID=3028685 RepID=UPI0029B7CABB
GGVAPPLIRQRNTTPYTFHVAETAGHPAYAVLPGETAEFPALLDGWTAAEDEPAAVADETPAKTPSRKRAATADTDTKDGGEPQ